MSEIKRKIYVWSEGGDIFCMEDGDLEPFDLDTNVYDVDADDYITAEMEGLQAGGYKIEIGRPPGLTDDWQIQMEQKYRRKGEG